MKCKVSGRYDITILTKDGVVTNHTVNNLVKREALLNMLNGEKVITSIALGTSVEMPTFLESLNKINPTIVLDAKEYIKGEVNNLDVVGTLYEWNFELLDDTVLNSITEFAVGTFVGETFTEFSRVIMQRDGRLVRLNKGELDKVHIKYSLMVSVTNVDEVITDLTLSTNGNDTTYTVIANLYPTTTRDLNVEVEDTAIRVAINPENPDNISTYDHTIEPEITLSSNSVSQKIDIPIINESETDATIVSDIYVYAPYGCFHYSITPDITLYPGGHINFNFNTTFSNGV